MVISIKALVGASTVQGCPLLEKLPIELRYMIYEHVFAHCAEMVLPHPLMLVSRQIQVEAITAAAPVIGPKVELWMSVNTKSVVYRLHYRFDENKLLRRFCFDRASGSASYWAYHAFGRYIFGPQFLCRMRKIGVRWQLTNTLFVIEFRPGALSPNVTLRTTDRFFDTRTRVTPNDANEMFLALAEKWRTNKSGCWEGLRKEARERMLRNEARKVEIAMEQRGLD